MIFISKDMFHAGGRFTVKRRQMNSLPDTIHGADCVLVIALTFSVNMVSGV